ncbi:hypothetical protein EWM64_g7449 [Hericium alpestre]|uniref:Mon2 C-terminal domain-containing protein n=1 Tax=Hericium alpestre TaxID=135208 RepID=A0A4Y9ZPQ4_9AGAM|nr:hypothetical protein EWM64_g7449 [Hericium alpestre]
MLDVLAQQIMLDSASSNATIELRRMGLETLHQILQASGHTLVVGWETIFDMLSSVCKPADIPPPLPSEPTSPVSSTARPRITPLGLGQPSEKGYTTLIKIAFQSMTLVCDSLSALSPEHLRMCISTLGHFGRQADTNIALTAAESLFWSVSDSIQAKRKDAEKEPEYSELWMFLLLEIQRLCTDVRPEVRMGAIQTLFRTLQLYGATLSADTWDECVWKVTFPLLDALGTGALQNPAPPSVDLAPVSQSWDESRVVAFQSVGAIFTDFLASKILHLESFARAWGVFVDHIRDAFVHGSRTISAPALRCLEKALRALRAGIADADADVKAKVLDAAEKAWSACDEMGDVVVKATNASTTKTPAALPFTQESLVVFMNVIQCTRGLNRTLKEEEWPLDRIARLLVILKGTLTYSHSPDIRPDIDNLSPLQSEVMSTLGDIVLNADGAPSLVLKEISEFANLSFSAASHDSDPVSGRLVGADASKALPKRVTYVALTKKCQPLLVNLFMQFKDRIEIHVNGTLEAVLWAYSIPIKMKYECPPASKFGKDPPLWKSATTNFLKIVKHIAPQLDKLDADIPSDRVEAIWRQTIDVFRGGILADCTFAESQPFDVQEEEETFDLTLIASLETDVVPYLGDRRISDHVITQLVKVLQQGSQLREYEPEEGYLHSPVSPTKAPSDSSRRNAWTHSEKEDAGSTEPGTVVSRERFSYWCFDLLFLVCSNTFQDHVDSRKRVAVLSLSLLLGRCRQTLAQYVADESLRGALPFPRVREEELVYVLHKLRELQVWPGSLWAALSDSPSDYATEQPAINPDLPPSELIADTIKRSSRAHLFHLYSVIGQIASVPRKAPSAWVMSDSLLSPPTTPDSSSSSMEIKSKVAAGGLGPGRLVSMDSRALARECLKEIGREMGVPP